MNILSKIKTLIHYILIKINKKIILIENVTPYKIKVIVSNNFEYQSRFKLAYTAEPLLNEWAEQIIGYNDIVYDIGANVGNYSILFAKKIQYYGGSGHIYCFEPNYINYKKLKKNVSINKVESFVTTLQIGIYNSDLISDYLEERPGIVGGSGKITEKKNSNSVLALKMDTIINLKNCQQPNHIKIDIDYFTNYLFEEINWLKLKSLKSVYIEMQTSNKKYLLDKLYQNDFELYKKEDKDLELIDANEASNNNYLFIKRENNNS